MKQLSIVALAGGMLLLFSRTSQAQDTFTLEEHNPNDIGLSILVSPTISATAPSIRTATLSQSNVGPGQPASPGQMPPVAGFMYADNNNGGLGPPAYGTNLNNIVITDAQDGTSLDTLTLTFAQPVTGLTFSFATIPVNITNAVTLNATTDNAAVFTSGTGIFNAPTQDYEGSLILSGGTFNVLNIFLGGSASVGDAFAVDNFVVTPSVTPVPEPGSIAVLVAGSLPIAWGLRRRAARRK